MFCRYYLVRKNILFFQKTLLLLTFFVKISVVFFFRFSKNLNTITSLQWIYFFVSSVLSSKNLLKSLVLFIIYFNRVLFMKARDWSHIFLLPPSMLMKVTRHKSKSSLIPPSSNQNPGLEISVNKSFLPFLYLKYL